MPRKPDDRVRPMRADVRAGVLQAARELFGELGFQRASLAMIAERAGYSKGAVYSNFDSKDELFLALLVDELQARSRLLSELTRTAGDARADLAQLAAGVLALAVDEPAANLVFAEFRAYAARDDDLSRRLAALRDLLVGGVAERLQTEVAARGLQLTVPATDAATVLLALVNGLALEQVGRAAPVVSVESLAVVVGSLVRPA